MGSREERASGPEKDTSDAGAALATAARLASEMAIARMRESRAPNVPELTALISAAAQALDSSVRAAQAGHRLMKSRTPSISIRT